MKKENAVAVVSKQDVGLLAELNGFSEEYGGLVQVRTEILKIPRLKLLQKSTNSTGNLGQVGDFVCEVKSINFGSTVKIIPIRITESASYLDKDTMEVLCRSDNLVTNQNGIACAKCPFNEYWNDWGTKDNKKVPRCKSSIDMLCLVGDDMLEMVFSFRKKSYPAGKALVNLVFNDKMKVPFGSSYKIRSKDDTQDKYQFKVVDTFIEKEVLTDDKVKVILPTVKRLLQHEKAGNLEREGFVDEEVVTPTSSVDDNCPFL